MTGTARTVYLHGFASSPRSNKATFFQRRFAEHGVSLDVPQLDEGNFEALTITRQMKVIDRAVGTGPAILIGSSLGGYLAALYAAHHSNIERVILMAPAFQFPKRWRERFPAEELALWKREGSRKFYHYSFQEERPLGYGFVEDADRYEDEPDFKQPGLILHGTADPVVPVDVSCQFAASHPNVTLRLFEAGHELTDVLEQLWVETAMFLGFQKL
ncbi:MAG: YqiA/YcfP family alpha/beta fold hydrolase [Bryobacteraceae bacterium]